MLSVFGYKELIYRSNRAGFSMNYKFILKLDKRARMPQIHLYLQFVTVGKVYNSFVISKIYTGQSSMPRQTEQTMFCNIYQALSLKYLGPLI